MGKVLSVRSVLGSHIDIIMALYADNLGEIGAVIREQIGEIDGIIKTTTLMCSPADPVESGAEAFHPTAYVLIETRPGRSISRIIEALRVIDF